MAHSPIILNQELQLAPLASTDAKAMSAALQNGAIVSQLASVNLPYSESDALRWIARCQAFDQEFGQTTQWAIRVQNQFAGEIGFHSFKPQLRTQASIGFWVAEPFQGRGIGKLSVKAALDVGFEEYGFKLVRAVVFEGNLASLALLESCGFSQLKLQKNYLQKEGKSIHCWFLEKTRQRP